MLAIRAQGLFDGRSVVGPAMVLVEGETITGVDVTGAGPPEGAEVVDFGGATLMPGLIDAHIHLAFNSSADPIGRLEHVPDEELLGEMVDAAASAMRSGATTVRDLGDRNYLALDVRGITREDPSRGPDILCAGPPLTTPGGHCWHLGGEVRGEAQIRAAIRAHASRGVDVIKVMVTGGMMTAGTDVNACQFTVDELQAAADEAHSLGLPITGHAHGVAGIIAAAQAEFDGIEHGTFMTPDGPCIDHEALHAILTSGAVVSAIAGLRAGAEPPVEARQFMEQLQAVRAELVRAGVPLIPGPDGGIGPLKPHNIMASAILRFSEIMTNTEALRAGTETAAAACRVADRKGKIAAGHDADLIVLDADPTTDLRTILNPVAVYNRGVLVA